MWFRYFHLALLCALGTLGHVPGAYAQTSEKPVAKELVSYAVSPSSDFSASGRSKFVRLLAAYCKGVLEALPTNTPSEEAWVKAEGQTSDTDKVRRLVASPEFARRQLKSTFESCIDETDNLMRAQGAPKGDARAHEEALAYLRIAFDFNVDVDILGYASKAGLNSAAWRLDFLSTIRRALIVASLRTLEGQ
jgi:hypothetical protein